MHILWANCITKITSFRFLAHEKPGNFFNILELSTSKEVIICYPYWLSGQNIDVAVTLTMLTFFFFFVVVPADKVDDCHQSKFFKV